MADSYVDFGVGAEDLVDGQLDGVFDNLTLDYISTADFSVAITDPESDITTVVPAAGIAVTTSPTLTVTLDFDEIDGYTALAATDLVRISRSTGVSSLQRTFSDGSVLKASDLNTQHKQLLFGLQEQVDGGLGSLPLDVDDKYDAGSRAIKNLASPDGDTEAATRQYVDNTALYGAAFGASEPQSWSFTTAAGDIEGSNRELILSVQVGTADPSPGPIPAATAKDFFIVELGGVIQAPATYTVSSETAGETTTYTLTLLGAGSGADEIDDEVDVSVRNFGIARNVFLTDITPNNDTSVGISITGYSAGQSADLQQWKEYDGTVLAKVGEDGSMTTTGDITAGVDGVMTAKKIELGDNTSFGTTSGRPHINLDGAGGNDGRIGVSTTGLYFIEDDDDYSIRFGVGDDGVINGIDDTNCLLEINSDAGSDANPMGVSVKKLDIVDSVLKIAGDTTMQIVGIHKFANVVPDGTGYDALYQADDAAINRVAGLRLTRTPLSVDSRFFIMGTLQAFAVSSSTGRAGLIVGLREGNTAAVGATVTGTELGGNKIISVKSLSSPGNNIYFVTSLHHLTPVVGSVSPITWDIYHALFDGSSAGAVYTNNQSPLYAVELIDPS